MKQFYALIVFLIAFTPAFSSNLVLSNSEDFTCNWDFNITTTAQITCKKEETGGSATVTFAKNKEVEGLHYTWYFAGTRTVAGTGKSLANLEAGSYYVEVQDPVSKCIQRAEATVEFKGVKPWFTVEYMESVIGCNAEPYGRIKMTSQNKWKAFWFYGDQVDDNKGITKYMSLDIFEELPPGTYTVVYEDPSTGCRSDPYTFTIEGWPISPVVNATITADTTCSGAGSGTLALTSLTPAPGTEPELGYMYEWRNSNGVVLSQFTNKATASPLPAGTYTVAVTGNYTNDNFECRSTVSFTVPHQPTTPVVSATSAPNTICTPPVGASYNGIITTSATYKGQPVTNFSNYTFSWKDANGATGSVTGTNLISKLKGGLYTVTATNNTLGCTSDPVTVEIKDQLPVQTLTLAPVAQTNCDNAAPNGSLTATYSITPTTATAPKLQWYRGTTISAFNEITGISGNTATGLAGGVIYTVVATDAVSGCQITKAIEVPLQPGVVTLTATPAPNMICAPATGVNGSINVTEVRFNNTVVTDLSGYTFSWFKGSSTTPISGQTTATLTGQAAGTYRVQATRTNFGCTSDPVTVEIKDQLPVQTLTLAPVAQTNCDNAAPNGSLTATYSITPATTTAPKLQWYRGTTVSAANEITSGISGNTLSGLAGGVTYTVVATDAISGCTTTTAIEVPLQPAVITLAATPTANAICAPVSAANGEITVNAVSFNGTAVTGFSDYTFSWSKEVNGTYTPVSVTNAASNTLTGQAAGRYQVRATNTKLACTSDPVTVEIKDQLPVQTLTLAPVAQTNCDNAAPNGSLTATYSITPATTTAPKLQWYRGTTVSAANEITSGISGNTLSGLAGGVTYTVVATDAISGCTTTTAIEVPLQPAVITLAATPTANAICAPVSAANGEITVNAVSFNGTAVTGFSDYTFSWSKEVNGTYTPVSVTNAASNTLTGQAAGRYQVRATNTKLACTSDPVTVEIKDQLPVQTLTLAPVAQTNCDNAAPNGSLTATYSITPATTTAPKLQWYRGTTVSAANEITSGISGNTLSGLAGGVTYTVVATDAISGCTTTTAIEVPLQPAVITLAATPTANAICAPVSAANGEITVNAVSFNGTAVTGFSDYTFSWSKEVNGTYTPVSVTNAASNTLTGQTAGRYQVRATNTKLACTSDPITVEIKDQLPVLNLALTPGAQTSCNGTPNGEITAALSIDGNTVSSADYSLEWFEGTDTTTPLTTATTLNDDLAEGIYGARYYTVRATANTSGCQTVASVYVPAVEGIITLTYTANANTICEPAKAASGNYDGDIFINSVLFNGGNQAADLSKYEFIWYEQSGSAYTEFYRAIGTAGQSITRLPGKFYQVEVRHTELECISTRVTIEVDNDPEKPTVELTQTRQTACDLAYSNGTLTATVKVNGIALPTLNGYKLEWFSGTTTDGTPVTTNLSNNDSEAGSLASGYYAVRVTNTNTGCVATASIFLEERQTIPTTELVPTDIQSCEPGEKGYLTATVSENGTPLSVADHANYEFIWYKGRFATGTPMVEDGFVLDFEDDGTTMLATGYYTVVAVNKATKCKSAPVTKYLAPPPALYVIDKEINRSPTVCNEDAGVITAWVDNAGFRDVSSYTFEWYEGRPLDPTATFYSYPAIKFQSDTPLDAIPANYDFSDLDDLGLVAGTDYYLDGASIFGLRAGVYTVVVTDKITGCKEMQIIELPSDNGHRAIQIDLFQSITCPTGVGGVQARATDKDGNIIANQSDYIFKLYKGNNPVGTPYAQKAGAPGYTEFDNLEPGFYTFLAQETLTIDYCNSISQSFEIEQVAVKPAISAGNILPSTMCTGGDGSAVITVGPDEYKPGAYDPITKLFTITLTGPTTTAPQTLVAAGAYSFTSLEIGTYTATVEGFDINGNYVGCSSKVEFTITNQPPAINVQAAATPQTYCSPINGSLAVTSVSGGATTDLADYTFEWMDATGTTLAGSTNGPSISGLAAGTYYVVATQNAGTGSGSGCKSAPVEMVIKDISVDPTVALEADPNTSCDPNVFTGEVRISSLPAGNFDYTWYFIQPDGTAVSRGTGNQSLYPPISNAGPGLYRIVVVAENGCEVTAEIQVGEEIEVPVIKQVTATPQTTCDPLITDGTIAVDAVEYNGTTYTAPFTDFVFEWKDANGALITDVNGNPLTTASIPAQVAGTYTVEAYRSVNPHMNCYSAPFTIKVPYEPVYPAVAFDTNTPNNACDTNYTGALTATVGFVDSFDYRLLLNGTPTTYAGTAQTNGSLSFNGLQAGLYTLEITQLNGCPVEAEITVQDAILKPVITSVDITAQTNCQSIGDGELVVSGISYNGITGTLSDYDFQWYDASNTLIGSNISKDQLLAGTYSVVATKKNTPPGSGCESAPFTVDVPYEPVYPAVAFDTNTPNNACDTNYTGALTATVGFVDSFDYRLLLNGTPTTYAGTAQTNGSLSFNGLQAGLYTLEITQLNGCPVEAEITVQDAILKPVITSVDITAQTNCQSIGDGELVVSGISYNGITGTLSDYDFQWYDASNTLIGSNISKDQLLAGTYSVVATKKNTPPGSGCESAPFTVDVPYEPVYPAVAFDTNTPNNACDTNYTGALTATVGFVDSFDYRLLLNGTPTTYAGTAQTNGSLSFNGLQAGLYTLEITQLNGCPVEAEITVQDAILKPVITSVDITAQTNCQSIGDGELVVSGISYNGITGTLSDYDFQWYDASNTLIGSNISKDQLLAGTYSVVATKKNTPPGSGCESAPFTVDVPYEPVYPAVAFDTNTPNNACDTNYTGALTATVGFVDSFDYRLLLNGTPTTYAGTAQTNGSLSFNGLQAGLYTLEITQLNGCPVEAEITVQDAILKPVITSVDITAQTNCQSIGDGELVVSGISYNGITGTLSDYDFQWYDASNTLIGSNISKDQLLAGTYSVVATKKNTPPGSGCESAPFTVDVPYEPVYPAVAFTASVNNTSCNASANGSFAATVSNFGAHFSYVLYKNGVATAYTGTNITNGTLSFSGMEEGVYKLEIAAENSCPTEAIVTLVKEEVSSSLLVSATDQTICNADGTITVNEVSFAGQTYSGADVLLNFSLSLLDENNQILNYTVTSTTAGARYENLPAGVYTVMATRLQPANGSVVGQGCSLTYAQAISDVSVAPAIEIVEYNMISACFGNPKGVIGASVDGYTTNPGNYTASWQFRQNVTDALQPYPGTGFRITGLDPGYYTVNITDNTTGCINLFEFEIREVVVDIVINASANDQTFCQPLDNGELFVRVANEEEIRIALGYLPSFDFEVYAGEWTTPPGSDYKWEARNISQFSKTNVSTNTYTVFAWFNGHLVCLGSDQAFVGYVDNTPIPTAQADAYLTICDPERPNASASASVNGVTDGYTFTWYKETVAPTSKHHQDGPVVNELSEGKYIVEVQHLITGCIGYTEVEVSAQYPDVPFVDAMLTATASTSCAAPNGSLEVNVVNREGFDFTWYRGETADATQLIPNGPVPYRQENLAEGTYTVIATDKANGCISNAVSKHLGGDYTYPDYDIIISPANCSVNGSARVVDLSGQLREYYIYDAQGNQIGDHNRTFEGPSGNYILKVVSKDGCDKSQPFEITDVVAPFNGVTANGDGDNDYFHLACIDMFPQNLLRIYNRAGGLVYEMSGYDNSLRVFDGTGNKGLYLGGKDLPAGTYYWVLFRDNVNEKPKTGFLELIR
ncbi:fg-gap repeat protein [Flammeovirgaceae bacterium 311]|nr:fg-gap repeat protein [Flammeovirgaceae bacterium 311]